MDQLILTWTGQNAKCKQQTHHNQDTMQKNSDG